jgi:hypothetical protein
MLERQVGHVDINFEEACLIFLGLSRLGKLVCDGNITLPQERIHTLQKLIEQFKLLSKPDFVKQ